MGAHKPKMIRVEVSDDNRTYHAIGELNFSPEEIYCERDRIIPDPVTPFKISIFQASPQSID